MKDQKDASVLPFPLPGVLLRQATLPLGSFGAAPGGPQDGAVVSPPQSSRDYLNEHRDRILSVLGLPGCPDPAVLFVVDAPDAEIRAALVEAHGFCGPSGTTTALSHEAAVDVASLLGAPWAEDLLCPPPAGLVCVLLWRGGTLEMLSLVLSSAAARARALLDQTGGACVHGGCLDVLADLHAENAQLYRSVATYRELYEVYRDLAGFYQEKEKQETEDKIAAHNALIAVLNRKRTERAQPLDLEALSGVEMANIAALSDDTPITVTADSVTMLLAKAGVQASNAASWKLECQRSKDKLALVGKALEGVFALAEKLPDEQSVTELRRLRALVGKGQGK